MKRRSTKRTRRLGFNFIDRKGVNPLVRKKYIEDTVLEDFLFADGTPFLFADGTQFEFSSI